MPSNNLMQLRQLALQNDVNLNSLLDYFPNAANLNSNIQFIAIMFYKLLTNNISKIEENDEIPLTGGNYDPLLDPTSSIL